MLNKEPACFEQGQNKVRYKTVHIVLSISIEVNIKQNQGRISDSVHKWVSGGVNLWQTAII